MGTNTAENSPSVTKLYLHKCEYGSCEPRWSKFSTFAAEEAALFDAIAEDPILCRYEYSRKVWKITSFTVQDEDMKAHLSRALEGYQDFDLELEKWTFAPPYQPIVHRWDRIDCIDEEGDDDDKAKTAVVKLLDFLRPVVASSIGALAETRKTGMIAWRDIWQIFPPGELVATTFYGVEGVCRVRQYEGKHEPTGSYWEITLEFVNWNGERCGYATTQVPIYGYRGIKHVVSLDVHPLFYRTDAPEVKARMIARGRKFETLRGYHYRSCVGTMVLLDSSEERSVGGRVIIDAFAYYHSKNQNLPELAPLARDDQYTPQEGSPKDVDSGSGSDSDSDSSSDSDSRYSRRRPQTGPAMTARKPADNSFATRHEVIEDLTDEERLLTTPLMIGFDMKTKEWAHFRIDELSPVVWNDAAFDSLKHPGNAKELAWSFVESKALAENTFDDFVQDKGRGLIILMFGPPGVGKTFTAEAVSERARVPLYSMSAGVLGTNPAQVEAALDRSLNLCKLWKAMLLLDEADVFLGTRTTADIARNELVALFLTKLEYYQGTCFLTTNRMASIDHAFQSRVDLFLPYAALTRETRKDVWLSFMDRLGRDKFDVSDAELDALAVLDLNGREIKNLVKSANLLTLKDGAKIEASRLVMLAKNRIDALTTLDGNDDKWVH